MEYKFTQTSENGHRVWIDHLIWQREKYSMYIQKKIQSKKIHFLKTLLIKIYLDSSVIADFWAVCQDMWSSASAAIISPVISLGERVSETKFSSVY